jgi:hypothetical protein
MGPGPGIVVKHSRGGHERYDLEERTTEGSLEVIVQSRKQEVHDPEGGSDEDADIEFELRVLDQSLELQLEDRYI